LFVVSNVAPSTDLLFEALAERVAEIVLARLPNPAAPEPSGFVPVEGAADFLGLSVPAVRMHVKRGTLPFHKIGKRVLFDRAELRATARTKAAMTKWRRWIVTLRSMNTNVGRRGK
jgi:excisionase family DNA binding protein